MPKSEPVIKQFWKHSTSAIRSTKQNTKSKTKHKKASRNTKKKKKDKMLPLFEKIIIIYFKKSPRVNWELNKWLDQLTKN